MTHRRLPNWHSTIHDTTRLQTIRSPTTATSTNENDNELGDIHRLFPDDELAQHWALSYWEPSSFTE